MFEYDRLSFDLTSTLTGRKTENSNWVQSTTPVSGNAAATICIDHCERRPSTEKEVARRSSLYDSKSMSPSSLFGFHSNAMQAAGCKLSFDCGASSGYGSPGAESTPLASPAFDESAPSSVDILGDLEKMLLADDEPPPPSSPPPAPKQRNISWPQASDGVPIDERKKSAPSYVLSQPYLAISAGIEGLEATPLAHEDGFSSAEIEQFAQLLSSPKKAPPPNYQCHICSKAGHYINDCPMVGHCVSHRAGDTTFAVKRFNSPFEQQRTPYQGRKKCYGEFQCTMCKRKWNSQNSVANEAQTCIKCHIAIYPHKQLPVDKAVTLGLVKSLPVTPPHSQQQRHLLSQPEHLSPFAMPYGDGGGVFRTK